MFDTTTIPFTLGSVALCLVLSLFLLLPSATALPTRISDPFDEHGLAMTSPLALAKTRELPVLFLSHAAPVLIMKEGSTMMGQKNTAHVNSAVANWYRNLPHQLALTGANTPKFIVQFSAHYETQMGPIKVLAQDTYKNGLLYDYYGFPDYTYNIKYPAAGSLALAKHIVGMLTAANVPAKLDTERGIDHGGFIPLSLMYPEADIPVLQISISPNSALQRKIGEILAPLRKNGVLFMGSGQATHGSFRPTAFDIKQQELFVAAMTKGLLVEDWASADGKESYTATTLDKPSNDIYAHRADLLDNWTKIPGAREAHPHPDHFLPLPSCHGVSKGGENQALTVVGDHWLMSMHSLRSFVWGEYPFKGYDDPTQQVPHKDEL